MPNNVYAPLPNPSSERDDHEMNAAFDDDSDDEDQETAESRPLAGHRREQSQSRLPATYDFENVDYDYPPPGSPPPLSAFSNSIGNSNGLVPSFTNITRAPVPSQGNWFTRRLRSILPTRYSPLPQRPSGAIGGGEGNDGVFSNVTAKPAAPITIQDGDETYVLPEETRAEAPPSYQSAQADAVPPYWETTVHAPFSPDSAGDIIIDNLPTGSLFSFLWNMLVSISFQFVGFLLTYLLHTTHSARLGSRAGLGVTLIQYGFALRNRMEYQDDNNMWGEWRNAPKPVPTMAHSTMHGGNHTVASIPGEQSATFVSDATTEWLSFFLMTVGWFILLTSLLGYWRVKRWERGILNSQRDNNAQVANPTQQRDQPASQFGRLFGIHAIPPGEMFRQGFGFGSRGGGPEGDRAATRAEEGVSTEVTENDLIIRLGPDDPDRQRLIREALANEQRIQNDLRAAGLL